MNLRYQRYNLSIIPLCTDDSNLFDAACGESQATDLRRVVKRIIEINLFNGSNDWLFFHSNARGALVRRRVPARANNPRYDNATFYLRWMLENVRYLIDYFIPLSPLLRSLKFLLWLMKRDEIISFYKWIRTTWNVFDIKIIGSFRLSYHFFLLYHTLCILRPYVV